MNKLQVAALSALALGVMVGTTRPAKAC